MIVITPVLGSIETPVSEFVCMQFPMLLVFIVVFSKNIDIDPKVIVSVDKTHRVYLPTGGFGERSLSGSGSTPLLQYTPSVVISVEIEPKFVTPAPF